MRYQVISPDVWGHVSADCCASFDCPCIAGDEHDDNACECSEDVNDWHKVGAIDVADDGSDAAILDALGEAYLTREGRAVATLDDYNGMGEHIDVCDEQGRLLLQLEQVES